MNVDNTRAESEMLLKIRLWMAQHPCWTLTIIALLILGPFLTKPFNIDDPLFILAAHQIQQHPADPYGFKVEWGFKEFPMSKVTENPPLTCYYVALAAGLFGWSEFALHTAMLLPTLAVLIGTYRLARHYCSSPMLASLAVLFTPVFLVSSLTIMCDMTMVAFWVWSVLLWVEGIKQNKLWLLWVAAVLIALAQLTKYFGGCLVPLLTAYGLASKHPWKRWVPCLLAPLVVLLIYHFATKALYGSSLLYLAMDDASFLKGHSGFSKLQSLLATMTFTGGCLAVAVIFAPLLWRGRVLAAHAAAAAVFAGTLFMGASFWKVYGTLQSNAHASLSLQIILWATGGVLVLSLAIRDWMQQRDALSMLLFLWVFGTFAFVAFFNWTINARTLLPLAPAVGILLARRLEAGGRLKFETWPMPVVVCLTLSLVLSLSVLQGDYLLAVATRQNAGQVCDEFKSKLDDLWFQGHWGFQYYMTAGGAHPLDFKSSPVKVGDAMAVPSDNSNLLPPSPRSADLAEQYQFQGPWLVTTCSQQMGAGFYASLFGPLPFAFGAIPPQTVSIYVIKPEVQSK